MYNKYVKEEHISYLKEWNNMLDSNLISGNYLYNIRHISLDLKLMVDRELMVVNR
jgi:hypothetical protein